MKTKIIVDKTKSAATAQDVPEFPWVRFDAGEFIWEEAFFNGNFVSAHYSAMGRCQSRERLFNRLSGAKFNKNHTFSFELEINGMLLKDRWNWEGEYINKPSQGFEELVVELSYQTFPIMVKIHTLMDGSAFLTRWLEIINKSDKAFAISRVYPWCGIIGTDTDGACYLPDDYRQSYLLGRYKKNYIMLEGEFRWEPLPEDTLKIEFLRKQHNPPMFIVKNELTGEFTVIHFENTGNMEVEFTRSGDPYFFSSFPPLLENYLHVRIGPAGTSTYRILQPGEVVSTPSVHFSMNYGDIDTCVNRLYEHLRKSVTPKQNTDIQHPVEYNHTGYTANAQISKQLLLDEVDVAAGIGAELFVVDAGWYGPKDKVWWVTQGDWYENPLLEGGLTEVFNYARSKGMKCGLWFEMELAGSESELAASHGSDGWFVGGGNCGILDITKPEVEEYMYNTIVNVIEKYQLDCFRLDHNVDMMTGGERTGGKYTENTLWMYYEALYRIFERVQKRFPGLYLENCSSGGARIDMGIMRRFHWTQITDNWHPAQQLRIFNGVTLGLPPEQCLCHIGAINMNPADIDFVVRAGLFGHFCASGVFPLKEKNNEYGLERWKHAIDIYKREIRPILSTCRVYHHTPVQNYREKGEWVVLEYVSDGASTAVVGIFRLSGSNEDEYLFVPKGLKKSRKYKIVFDNENEGIIIPGYQLCTTGIPVKVKGVMMSELLIIKECEV